MLNLDPNTVANLPVDQLGLAILPDLIRTKTWHEGNYLNDATTKFGPGPATRAVAEAMGWLRARSMIARDPGQSADGAIFVTRLGHRVAAEGKQVFFATERLQGGLHPSIEPVARPQFLIGAYEQGVFASMKAVEVRVRRLAGFGDDIIGADLMNKAFGPTGPLTDMSAVPGERDGVRSLFVGAYAVFRNPSGHREVNYDDVAEAAEMVQAASLLMRILDRVEARRRTGTPPAS